MVTHGTQGRSVEEGAVPPLGPKSKTVSTFYDEESRKLLFPEHRLAGIALTSAPWLVAISLSVLGAVVIFPAAYFLHLLSIDGSLAGRPGENVGIAHRFHFSILYPLGAPLFFALAASVCRNIRSAIRDLVSRGRIQAVSEGGQDLDVALEEKLESSDNVVFWSAILTTFAISIIDAWHNFNGYYTLFTGKRAFTSWDEFDWMNAAAIASYQSRPHAWANFTFYVAVLLLQGLIIFAAIYFVVRYWLAIRGFGRLIVNSGRYVFKPFILDPDACLGLKPIGNTYSFFLLSSALFQIYAVYHRLQLMRYPSFLKYFSAVADAYSKHDWGGLVALCHFDRLNPGMRLVLLFLPLPVAVISWWPLIKLRGFVDDKRKQLLDEHEKLYNQVEARPAEDEGANEEKISKMNRLKEAIDALKKACVWPNGYQMGWGLFFVLVGLGIGAILPPILVILAVTGVAAKAFSLLKKGRSSEG
jgi:hypothetical protein